MGKLLFWAILILAVLIVTRLLSQQAARRHSAQASDRNERNAPGKHSNRHQPETMVRCAHCGVYVPRSEALLRHDQLWCCEAHARLGAPR